jgi:acetate kinase
MASTGGPRTRPAEAGATATLVLNAGSSSLKIALLDAEDASRQQAEGVVRRVGSTAAILELAGAGSGQVSREDVDCPDHRAALRLSLEALGELISGWKDRLVAIGHRVVHGGSLYTRPTLLTHEVEARLDAITELAPLHNGAAVQVMRAALASLPHVPQVACFDTMFHASLPRESARYALPREIVDRYDIRRYGFHGLSCEWSMSRLRVLHGHSPERVIICHLGAGASVTAVRAGSSFDTSMGFTPLEGLIMATRSGSIDPAIPLFLLRHAGLSIDQVQDLLERQSGLLGLSGTSGDVQLLEECARGGDLAAGAALSAFAYRVRATIGADWAVLGGIDALVMTGGIGEHSVEMRTRILKPLASIGVPLDEAANSGADGSAEARIDAGGPAIWVIPAHEERVIATQVAELLFRRG